MHIDILSLFPQYFSSPLNVSIMKRAQENGLLTFNLVDIRQFSQDKFRRVDDRPYGGGPGMVMMADPVCRSIRQVRGSNSKVIYLSPRGKPLTAAKCRKLAREQHLILLCGHYEGIDQRAIDIEVDEEISIGDVVLTNGCLAALVLIDAVSRYIPGVLGDEQSASEDSFENGLLDCPHYTKPEIYEERGVPEVLLSGNHAEIARFRHEMALATTKHVRYDLYLKYLIGHVESEESEQDSWTAGDDDTIEKAQSALQIIVEVDNIDASLKFYRTVFDATVIRQARNAKAIYLGGYELVLVKKNDEKTKQSLLRLNMALEKERIPKAVKKARAYWQKEKNTDLARIQSLVHIYEDMVVFIDPNGIEWIITP